MKLTAFSDMTLCISVDTVACAAVTVQWPRDGQINNGVMQTVSRRRIRKHVRTATNTHSTIELLLETLFSTLSVLRGYKEDNWGNPVS
jgi:hypothetical protein